MHGKACMCLCHPGAGGGAKSLYFWYGAGSAVAAKSCVGLARAEETGGWGRMKEYRCCFDCRRANQDLPFSRTREQQLARFAKTKPQPALGARKRNQATAT